MSQQAHSCPKSRTFEIFPISWLTPVSLYKPIRYSISLSVGYHPMRLRHRVPSTLRCVTPLHPPPPDCRLPKRQSNFVLQRGQCACG
uniref:Uncharacterized protein n=1 Tax=Hyaloperonospora arabidopsidis (strain Emoy2) TaxID=559515 RepID=M4BAS8_HYAAE